ncbi:MAG: DUF1573 domain-containing protein [Planctomycetes bacterium]|nr:DUF1573 domain-containing protein [Planctomycetota bacterium]
MRRCFITLAWLLAAGSPVFAQDWAADMFDHTTHDFGVVARGQKVEHRFPIENIYVEDVTIESVQSSCSCTEPKVTQKTLKMYDQGAIVAIVDTRNFLARKEATFKVKLKVATKPEPLLMEAQLHCYVYIRSDVVLEPGTIRFDSVPYGVTVPAKKLSITYAGRSDWEILRAESDNPHLNLRLSETGRFSEQGTWRVTYDLFVDLKAGAPVGYIRDHVRLITNDRNENASHVVVVVEGVVTPAVSIRPSSLMLGLINPGRKVERILLVRGRKAFRILDVAGPNDQFQFETVDEAKTLHVIPVTFTAGETPGKVTGKIQIKTDVSGSALLEVEFDGRVVATDS